MPLCNHWILILSHPRSDSTNQGVLQQMWCTAMSVKLNDFTTVSTAESERSEIKFYPSYVLPIYQIKEQLADQFSFSFRIRRGRNLFQ